MVITTITHRDKYLGFGLRNNDSKASPTSEEEGKDNKEKEIFLGFPSTCAASKDLHI